ncbi:MAG TPA: hypothetical protein VGQ95_03260 [Chthoniobacterales bacterium]|nr:hypothetical protein [Chthoniobacterales bacterium]
MPHALRFGFVSCLFGLLITARTANAQEAVTRNVEVEAEELPSAYGAPPDLSRGRISTLTKSYVLPPFSFELETIYEGDAFRHGLPRHLFTQEVEMGLPLRFDVAVQNEVEHFAGDTDDRTFSITGRYALADWNKIPLNPTLFAEYKFGIGETSRDLAVPDAVEFGVILSHDFRHMVEWAMNWQEVNGSHSTDWGFAQSVEIPVLLPEERLEVGLEMQYRHAEETIVRSDQPRGFVIGPTLAWRPTKSARFDFSPLFGCTGDSPRVQISAVFSWSFGKPKTGEAETPASARNR